MALNANVLFDEYVPLGSRSALKSAKRSMLLPGRRFRTWSRAWVRSGQLSSL